MSTQKEKNLPDFPAEMRELRVKVESLLPNYLTALRRVCQIPQEFERRFWVSRVEALVRKVKTDYENYTSQALMANLFGKWSEAMVNLTLQAIRQAPVAPITPLQTCISIHPSGRIEPALFDSSSAQQDVILLRLDKFEAISRRLEDEIMEGRVVPQSEEEIPKLIHRLALESPQEPPGQLT